MAASAITADLAGPPSSGWWTAIHNGSTATERPSMSTRTVSKGAAPPASLANDSVHTTLCARWA